MMDDVNLVESDAFMVDPAKTEELQKYAEPFKYMIEWVSNNRFRIFYDDYCRSFDIMIYIQHIAQHFSLEGFEVLWQSDHDIWYTFHGPTQQDADNKKIEHYLDNAVSAIREIESTCTTREQFVSEMSKLLLTVGI